MWRMYRALLTGIALLLGCDGYAPPLATAEGSGGAGSAFDCPASEGTPRVELCDGSEEHRPVEDGVTYEVRNMPQGFTVIMTPVWFGGLPGGEVLEEMDLRFVTDAGDEIAGRNNRNWMLPCDDNDNVAANWLDTILPSGTQPGDYHAVTGTQYLTVELSDGTVLTDEVTATLEHTSEW
jgi:hypothetical protein